jgi:hypothetical protein
MDPSHRRKAEFCRGREVRIMLRSVRDMNHFSAWCSEGPIGRIRDVLFDDRSWAVRYVVVALDGTLGGRNVLFLPSIVVGIEDAPRRIRLSILMVQLGEVPGSESDPPVFRQKEEEIFRRFIPLSPVDGVTAATRFDMLPLLYTLTVAADGGNEAWDEHLRSSREVMMYRVCSEGRSIGRIADFRLDDERWRLDAIDARSGIWPARKENRFDIEAVRDICWARREVAVVPRPRERPDEEERRRVQQ